MLWGCNRKLLSIELVNWSPMNPSSIPSMSWVIYFFLPYVFPRRRSGWCISHVPKLFWAQNTIDWSSLFWMWNGFSNSEWGVSNSSHLSKVWKLLIDLKFSWLAGCCNCWLYYWLDTTTVHFIYFFLN